MTYIDKSDLHALGGSGSETQSAGKGVIGKVGGAAAGGGGSAKKKNKNPYEK